MTATLIDHSQSSVEVVQLTALLWLEQFVMLSGRSMLPHTSGILTAVLPTLPNRYGKRKQGRYTIRKPSEHQIQTPLALEVLLSQTFSSAPLRCREECMRPQQTVSWRSIMFVCFSFFIYWLLRCSNLFRRTLKWNNCLANRVRSQFSLYELTALFFIFMNG